MNAKEKRPQFIKERSLKKFVVGKSAALRVVVDSLLPMLRWFLVQFSFSGLMSLFVYRNVLDILTIHIYTSKIFSKSVCRINNAGGLVKTVCGRCLTECVKDEVCDAWYWLWKFPHILMFIQLRLSICIRSRFGFKCESAHLSASVWNDSNANANVPIYDCI